jgi:hypothetical protein
VKDVLPTITAASYMLFRLLKWKKIHMLWGQALVLVKNVRQSLDVPGRMGITKVLSSMNLNAHFNSTGSVEGRMITCTGDGNGLADSV